MSTPKIIGSSKRTRQLKELIRSIAPSDGSVLIMGESGCGKELYARALHDMSDRSDKPFIPINCGAIPSELLESQLFGHKKGSFTGAISDFKGKFLDADGGTLFLDEIGDMPFDMQVKLLRVLQEKTISPIGSNQLLNVNVRVVAATHRNVEQDIKDNKFRQDLYFRLNVLPLVIPPLRERPEEIPELVEYFAAVFGKEAKERIRLSPSFMSLMERYDWPGNIRELSNTIHRFSILYPGESIDYDSVDPTMLPAGMLEMMQQDRNISPISDFEDTEISSPNYSPDQPMPVRPPEPQVDAEFESIIMQAQGFSGFAEETPSLKTMLGDIEQDLIAKALGESGGNVSRCAKLLKMQRTTLIERMKKYDLQAV